MGVIIQILLLSVKMSDEFFVTLFSNSSMDIYPENTMSSFTCKLPRPIKLEGNYRVGMVEIQYPPILGRVRNHFGTNDENDEDVIELPTESNYMGKTLNLQSFIFLICRNIKSPRFYENDRYFNEFNHVNKLTNFEENFAKYDKNIKSTEKTLKYYSVVPQVKQFRSDDDIKVFNIPCTKYKLKEILYRYLEYHYQTYKSFSPSELAKLYNIAEDPFQIGYLLFQNAKAFIDELRTMLPKVYNIKKEPIYLAIHTDIVEPRIIGNQISKILYFGSKHMNAELDEIYIQNIQFVPLSHNYIEEISFLITDETGIRILFESGYYPLSITLKFEKYKS